MQDFTGNRVKRATPGQPVEMLGFDGVPEAGELVRMVENERRARQLAGERANRLKTEALARRSGRKVSLEDVFKLAQEGAVKQLSLVVKAGASASGLPARLGSVLTRSAGCAICCRGGWSARLFDASV